MRKPQPARIGHSTLFCHSLLLFSIAFSPALSLSLFGLTLAIQSVFFSRTSCGIVVWLLPFDCAHNKNWHIFLVSMRLLLLCSVFTFHNCRAQWKLTHKKSQKPKNKWRKFKMKREREREGQRVQGRGEDRNLQLRSCCKSKCWQSFSLFVPCRWKPFKVVPQFPRDYKWIKRLLRNPFKNCIF